MIFGSAYYVLWFWMWYRIAPGFAIAYVFIPFFENIILLACINWCWHAFINPEDPEDPYVQSITILDGQINVLNEDYHVVHHQYPGGHWEDYVGFRDKHWGEYITRKATCFRSVHTFLIFFTFLFRDYEELANTFVDLKGEAEGKPMTQEEKIVLLKARLRACWWGPRASAENKLKGGEIGNLMDGQGEEFVDRRT